MSTGLDVFDTSLEKTNTILKGIENDLGWEGRRHQAYSALRAVLHALRDRLPVEDSVNFSSQLPLILKGVYFDEWKPESVPIKMNRAEFIQYIRCQFPLDTKESIDEVIKTVMSNVFDHIEPGEAIKVLDVLPEDLADLISE